MSIATLRLRTISLSLSGLLVACAPTATRQPPPVAANTPPPIPDNTPILQLDSGGHMGLIRDIAFTPDGRYLLSAGDDKTLRVWDVKNGGAPRLLRGQLGVGNEGKIYAMALAPDGRTVAVGGYMEQDGIEYIRLHDLATGRVVGLLSGHSNVVHTLAFAANGRYLVSGSMDNTAIIWDLASRKPWQQLRGHTKEIYGVAFTPDSQRVVTASLDNELRLWATVNGQLLQRLVGHTDDVTAVAVAADGTIASGSDDHTIRLWDGDTGKFIRQLANQGTQVVSLSFSPDSKWLLSGVGDGPCHLWSVASGQQLQRYTGHDNIVLATAFSADGRLAATAGGDNKEIHLWDPLTGKLQQRLAGGGATTWAVGIAGTAIAWGYQGMTSINQATTLEYQISFSATGPSSPTTLDPSISWQRAQPVHADWSLQHVAGGDYGYAEATLEIRQGNTVRATITRDSTDGYAHRAYSFTPSGTMIISGGGNGWLSAYDRTGQKHGDFIGHTGDILAVAVSADGRLLVSGSNDQTVRLWDVASRELLLTLFHKHGASGAQQWVAWTPQGYYAASAAGDRMVGWQINKGAEHTPDFITAEQLHQHFYRPAILSQAVQLGSAQRAIAQAGVSKIQIADLLKAQPPRFQIVQPHNEHETASSTIEVVLDIPDQTPTLQQLRFYVNDRQAKRERMIGKTSLPTKAGSKRHKQNVTLDHGPNLIRIVATNEIGETPKELTVLFNRPQAIKGDLYLVAVGVSDYAIDRWDLKHPAADARDFVQAIKQQTTGLYNNIHTRLLNSTTSNSPPTAANIRAAWQIFKQAKDHDTSMLFLAGHGSNSSRGYYFLPHDARELEDPAWLDSVILWEDLQTTLSETIGRRILFVDTCRSGGTSFNSTLIKNAEIENIIVLSASEADGYAREDDDLGHGFFTYAILEGLSGKADMVKDNNIMIKELDAYISSRVSALTDDIQNPVINVPNTFRDFVFAQR